MKTFHLVNPKYGITGDFTVQDEVYDRFLQLHPRNTEKILQNYIFICDKENGCTSEDIEEIINSEYEVVANLDTLIEKARRIYAENNGDSEEP